MTRVLKNRWNKSVIISVAVHFAVLFIPVTVIVRQQMSPIEVSLVTHREDEPPLKREAKKAPSATPEPPNHVRRQGAQRPEEPKDVKPQIVSPGERTVMEVSTGSGDAATGVAIAGAKVGLGGTTIGGSMPGTRGTGTTYGYGGDGTGVVEGQFGEGEGPSFSHREAPEYPFAARRSGKEGRVVLELTIDSMGKLGAVSVLEASDTIFVDSALVAINKSTFVPGKKDGLPWRYRCKVVIRFTLGRQF